MTFENVVYYRMVFYFYREGSQSPVSRKRKRCRRRSLTEDSTIENQDASNSSDMPQQMGVPALGVTPVADEKVHADPTDSLGRSALMTQLTKPADEMLQVKMCLTNSSIFLVYQRSNRGCRQKKSAVSFASLVKKNRSLSYCLGAIFSLPLQCGNVARQFFLADYYVFFCKILRFLMF